jgi:DNA-binding IscR family transcriptional regulator
MERTAGVSAQTELGLGALRVLAHWPTDWDPSHLADALGTRPDLLGEVVARLAAAGWVHVAIQSGRLTYRYADPQPAPTLYELIQAVEGASAADDCVLGLGPCAGLSGGPVCTAHHAWLRELGWSALIATSLMPPRRSLRASTIPRLRSR